jgi:hypothetical protein
MNSRTWIAVCGVTAILAGGALALAVTGPFGTPPRVVPYGGTLEQNGVAVSGSVPMTFYILNSPTAALSTALWSEDYPAASPVDVVGGRFSVSLGSRTAGSGIPDTVFQTGELYVGIKVAGVELAGRQRLLANPFSITAAQARDFSVNGTLTVNGAANVAGTVSVTQGGVSVTPQNDANGGLRVSGGSNSNVVVQPLVGQAFQAINFNGYFNAGEQRFNTSKQRWRMAVDQRSTSDNFFLDRWDGTNGQTVMSASASGAVALRGYLTRVNNACSANTCAASCPSGSSIVYALGLHGGNLTSNSVHTAGICGQHQEWLGSCLGGTTCSVGPAACASTSIYLLCANQL